MTIEEAIETIREFNRTYEDNYKDLSDIEALLESANFLIAEYTYSEWLRLKSQILTNSTLTINQTE